jgi:hypothetical protein
VAEVLDELMREEKLLDDGPTEARGPRRVAQLRAMLDLLHDVTPPEVMIAAASMVGNAREARR